MAVTGLVRSARAVVAVSVVLAGVAAADDGPLQVRARLDGDVARFSVRYRVDSSTTDEAGMALCPLPENGLVTGAAVVDGGGRRRTLALVPAEQADTSYNALFEKPPGPAPTRAVMLDAVGRRDQFRINAALPARSAATVETQIAVPTCYAQDARYVSVPEDWLPLITAGARRVNDNEVPATCSGRGNGNPWIAFPARQLAARRGGADRVGAHAGRAKLGSTHLVKLELNLAGKLSEVPADLATAIVVDASRSMAPEDLEAQRDAIAAYLKAVPHSRVQVIAYARRARALLPAWMDAGHAAVRVERELQGLRPANGSSVEAGLREAGRWLGQHAGTRRIVLFTDEHLAARTEHTRAADDAIPPNTLVHVVALGGEGFERDDDARLARLAVQTRGLSVRGGARPAADGEKLDATLLARPVTLDHVLVRTPGFTAIETHLSTCSDGADLGDDEPQSMAEGDGCTWWGTGAGTLPFTVEGMLWNQRVVRVLHPDPGRALDIVREASMLDFLDEELQKLADRAARAVNDVWSLYAAWGGDDGYETGFGFGTSGSSTWCSSRCRGGLIGHGIGVGAPIREPDLAAEFRRIVETACKPRERVALEVETTLEEIVDVTVDARDAALRTCAAEALWSAWLVAPNAPSHAVTAVTL